MKSYSPIQETGGRPRARAGAKRQRILVTGANGQVGSEFRDIAASYPQFDFLFTSREELPIDNYLKVDKYFAKHRPQVCINCAAYTAVDKAELPEEERDVFSINADSVEMLAAHCLEKDARFIHISTDYVFDGAGTRPYSEDDPTEPLNTYGSSKLTGEENAIGTNPDTLVVRSSWIYSAHGKNFVKTMLRLMREKSEIGVVNDQFGSPTYAADLAEAIMQIVITPAWNPGVYHYANAGAISWFDFATAIRDISGSSCQVNPISTSQFPTPAKRPQYSVFDTKKIQQTFGIQVKDWKESLTICIGRLSS